MLDWGINLDATCCNVALSQECHQCLYLRALCISDGCDGKQARRTGTSSPLGEMFDHGLDSWSAAFFIFNVYSIFGRELVSGK